MKTVTRDEFKQWQLLPAVSPEAEENRSPSLSTMERGVCRTVLRNPGTPHSVAVLIGREGRRGDKRHPQPDFNRHD